MSELVGNSKVRRQEFRFTGGLDYSTSPETISPECMTRADNVEYSVNGVLKKADGITALFTSGAITAAYPFNGKTIYNNDQNLYYVDLTAATPTATLIGTLTGNNLNKQSFAYRDTDLLIASGGHLQKLDTSWNLTTISSSPYCDRVKINNGRIMAALTADAGGTDSDYLYWSAITDDAVWDLTPQPQNDWTTLDPASYYTTALFLEIGYRDGLNIISIQELANDFIVTKATPDGKVCKQYRCTGTFPNWKVSLLEPAIHVVDAEGTVNDIVTIGKNGVNSFSTVIQYGDIQKDETGRKVNWMIAGSVTSDAMVWHIPLKKQVAIKAANNKVLWLYHYGQCNVVSGEYGAWTKRILSGEVSHIWEDGNAVYLAMGTKLCKFDDTVATQDGSNFIAIVMGKRFTSSFMFNPVHYILNLENNIAGTGQLAIGGYREALTFNNPNDIAAGDTDIAAADTDIAAGDTFYQRDVFFECALTPDFTPYFSINTGSVGIRYLALDYSEV